jgi:predicted porin
MNTVALTYSNVRFSDLGDTTSGANPLHYTGTAMFNNAEVSYRYRLTAAWLLGAAYDYTDGNGTGGNGGALSPGRTKRAVFCLEADHGLRDWCVQHASGIDSTGKPAVAAINLLTPSNSDSQAVVRVGLRHKF